MKDLTQTIKECLQNLIRDWNVAVDTESGLQQDSRGTLSRPAPASASERKDFWNHHHEDAWRESAL